MALYLRALLRSFLILVGIGALLMLGNIASPPQSGPSRIFVGAWMVFWIVGVTGWLAIFAGWGVGLAGSTRYLKTPIQILTFLGTFLGTVAVLAGWVFFGAGENSVDAGRMVGLYGVTVLFTALPCQIFGLTAHFVLYPHSWARIVVGLLFVADVPVIFRVIRFVFSGR